MKIDMSFIPDGKSGDWEVSTFDVPVDDFSQKVSMLKTGRGVPPGAYKKLSYQGSIIMSNTPDEINDFLHLIFIAKGSILINGLGLGCVVKALLDRPQVEEITVIELSSDVITLVAPHFNDERLTVIHGNAFTWQPPKSKRYDFVWHDIWPDICADNLYQMASLHRKYGRKTEWQDSWAKSLCQRQKIKERFCSYF